MTRALVSGAGGFVGANLVRRLLADGCAVHAVISPTGSAWRLASAEHGLQIHRVDLADERGVEKLVREARPDWIFHLAAHGAYSHQNDWRRMVRSNLVATAALLEACMDVGFQAFVNTGSSSEYGSKDHAPAETAWLEPNSCYAVTKASATLYCRHLARERKLWLSTLRLYSVYGPFEEPTRLIPTVIVRGLQGVLPPLVDPSVARDYVHVDDVAEAYMLAATRRPPEDGAVYNVGTGVQTSIAEVVGVVRRTFGIAEEPRWGTMPSRSWDTSVWVSDPRRIEGELGWRARSDFATGFARTVAWFREDAERVRFYARAGGGEG